MGSCPELHHENWVGAVGVTERGSSPSPASQECPHCTGFCVLGPHGGMGERTKGGGAEADGLK